MEQTFSSVRDFLQQQNLPATLSNANNDAVAIAVLRLSGEPEEESIETNQLGPGELEHIRRTDPFMYHSIVNETTGRKVCKFSGAEAGIPGNADAAAGGVIADGAPDQGDASSRGQRNVNPRPISRRSSMPSMHTSHVVRRQRRFSTEEALSSSFLDMMLDDIGNLDDDDDENLFNRVNASEHTDISRSFANDSDGREVASQVSIESRRISPSVSMPSFGATYLARHQQRFSIEPRVGNEPQEVGQADDIEEDNLELILRFAMN